jgi:hypothetical protein
LGARRHKIVLLLKCQGSQLGSRMQSQHTVVTITFNVPVAQFSDTTIRMQHQQDAAAPTPTATWTQWLYGQQRTFLTGVTVAGCSSVASAAVAAAAAALQHLDLYSRQRQPNKPGPTLTLRGSSSKTWML